MAHTIQLQGDLDAQHVPAQLQASSQWFKQSTGQDLTIDLSTVGRADSAGVALLLDWTRQAQTASINITFCNVPKQIRALIDFYRLENVLNLQ